MKREYRARQQAAARAVRGKPPPLPKEPRARRRAAPATANDPYASGRPVVTTLVGLGMVAVVLGVVALVAMPGRPPAQPAADRVPVIVPTPSATATAADPFAGTKVDHWPAGAAGVVAPSAKAVGAFSAAQVRDAYARTERYLRAALLDRRVLYGRSLTPVRAAVDPRLRATPLTLGNRFAPDAVAAHPAIRVNGDFRAAGVNGQGRLEVAFRYVTVQALRPKRGGATELVVVRRTGRLSFAAAGLNAVTPPWIVRATYISGHSQCGARWPYETQYLPVFFARESVDPTAAPDAKERVNLLDPRAKDPAGCFTDTSTL